MREEAPGLGDIANDFDFSQSPKPPVLLPTHPAPGPASNPPGASAPSVVTMDAVPNGATATLNATVNPNGEQVSSCRFEYGASLPYSSSAPCSPSPGAGESAVAVSAQATGLKSATTYHFRISATSEGGTSVGEDQTFQTGQSLPERGRCLSASVHAGGYSDAACTSASAPGAGAFEWIPGAGAPNFALSGGPVTLETKRKAGISCASIAGSGEYTSAKTELLMLTLSGCEMAGHGSCHNEKATSGEITLSPLEGDLGVIKTAAGKKPPTVGVSLHPANGQANLAEFLCGPEVGGVKVLLEGSTIAALTPVDAMSQSYTLKLTAKKGKQTPEAFAGGVADVLLASFGEAAAERAALTSSAAISAQEAVEIKAIA